MGMVADRDVSLEPLFWGLEGWRARRAGGLGGLGIIVGFIAGAAPRQLLGGFGPKLGRRPAGTTLDLQPSMTARNVPQNKRTL